MTPVDEGHLAPYALRAVDGGIREHPEPPDPLRSPFALDRHRIIESTAFRRLEHKTQVFAPGHHDHFRTRLTHSLEVAQVARTLAVALRANESLCEAIALAHDLGHPPFGHAGEVALDGCMHGHGGFNHNTHALRVVEYLEHPFPSFRGLNLTRAVRDGIVAHESRYDVPQSSHKGDSHSTGPSVEAQIVSMADRLAYNCHDLEDGIGAGFIGYEVLETLPLWRRAAESSPQNLSAMPIHAVRRLILDALLNLVISDVVETSNDLVRRQKIPSGSTGSTTPFIAPSRDMNGAMREMEDFLRAHVYRRPEVAAMDQRGRELVSGLFAAYRLHTEELPPRFTARIPEQGVERVVCDYISGMTDRFCVSECQRLGISVLTD